MDKEELNRQSREAWDTNAAFWDERMADGNDFQRLLIAPTCEKLLQLQPGEEVLEIACGNGVFTRRMAQLGVRVLATDFSEPMLERARIHKTDYDRNIEYKHVDATKEDQLLALGEERFDAVVCNQAIMDMADIEPMARALPRLLKPGGRFVFSLLHPCFNISGVTKVAEEADISGVIKYLYSVKISRYKSEGTAKGLAMYDQPVAQPYFERTLTTLFNTFFQAGLVMDGLEEPTFDETETDSKFWYSWINFKEIPPVLIARMRPAR